MRQEKRIDSTAPVPCCLIMPVEKRWGYEINDGVYEKKRTGAVTRDAGSCLGLYDAVSETDGLQIFKQDLQECTDLSDSKEKSCRLRQFLISLLQIAHQEDSFEKR